MSFSTRFAPAVLFTVLSFAVAVCAQTATKQTTKTPRGSISGRITIKDKGAAGVAVGLRKGEGYAPAPSEPFVKTTTDHDGYYRFGNLAAGPYEVFPSAPAYIIDNSNQKSKGVVVGEDENVDGINFSLVRGGVITGKVTDADGRALIQQPVFLYRADTLEQPESGPQRAQYATTSAATDDRGIYRMYGLAAGRYKVAAGRSDDTMIGVSTFTRRDYKQVFHPDATEPAKATVIEVREGSEATNVDIALGRAQQTFSASGRFVHGEKGTPLPNLRFGLRRVVGRRFDMVPTQVTTNALGDFVIDGLVPGKYGAFLFPVQGQYPYPDLRVESLIFEIVDQDLTGLTIKMVKGATLSGVVVLESDDKSVHQRLRQMQLRAFVMPGQGGSSGLGQPSMSAIAPDGSFHLEGLGGGTTSMYLGAAMGSVEPKGFQIARVERDGIVTPPRGFEVKDGENITGLRVFVVYGSASLRGVVKLENGSLPPDAEVFVRLTKPNENFSNLMPPRVDARGHFLMESIPPGTYELHTSIISQNRQGKVVKQQVILQDGIVTDVVVTVDLATTPK